ncbi:MAG: hypothetical protein J5634_03620 [Bacilli bacterium]|nr:hypothetical protein [Bacilli bacterium]
MQDVKTYLKRLYSKEITPEEIFNIFSMLLKENNLLNKVSYIRFINDNNNHLSSDVAVYFKEQKTIIFDLKKLESKINEIDKSYFDDIVYSQIVTLNEIYIALEKVFVENIDSTYDHKELLNIKNLLIKYKENHDNEKNKYFDLNDNDVKVYSKIKEDNIKIDMLSPIDRYIKLKAFFKTVDAIKCMYKNREELIDFYNNNVDIISNGYGKEGNTITYPIYNYFSKRNQKEGKKYLRECDWYEEDYMEMLSNVSNKYSFEERLIYGMPIDTCEYRLIRKNSEG